MEKPCNSYSSNFYVLLKSSSLHRYVYRFRKFRDLEGLEATALIQYEAAGISLSLSLVGIPLLCQPSRCVNKADFSHWFSSQQDALRNFADVKTLLPSSELVSSGRETDFVICVLIWLCSEKSKRMSNCKLSVMPSDACEY